MHFKLFQVPICMVAIWYAFNHFFEHVYLPIYGKKEEVITTPIFQVLERAKEGESLEELRARTAAQFSDGQDVLGSTKLSKKRKHMAVLDEGSVKFGRIAD